VDSSSVRWEVNDGIWNAQIQKLMNISSFPIMKFLKTTCSKNEYWNANEDENEEIDTNSDEDKDDDVV
jgi:hypothetical protein